jgi:hypothetical protein
LEKLGIDLQDHPSDLPVNTMLRGAASWTAGNGLWRPKKSFLLPVQVLV